MFSRSRWVGVAGLFVLLAAGCTNGAAAAPPARTWHGFASSCPALTAPPYGVAANGKRITSSVAPGEQATLDKVVPGATLDGVTCEYVVPGQASPLITADIKIFGGDGGATQATAWFQSEKSAAGRVGGGVDNADVPGVADGGVHPLLRA